MAMAILRQQKEI
jgi:hypothetical protein